MSTTDKSAPSNNHKVRTPAARVAPDLVHRAAPALGWYTDEILFGEVWARPQLSGRDRSFLTISALITYAFTKQMTGHFNRALTNGIQPTEIVEVITHLAFYAGWPCAMSAVPVMQEVFTARGIGPEQVTQNLGTAPAPGGTGPAFEDFTERVVMSDLWMRKELAPRDRSLVTITSCIAQCQLDELPAQLKRGRQYGLREDEMLETVVHLAFYIGWPRAAAAKGLVHRAFQD